MSTIKSYTDIEQSKKLAEILSHESADMCYPPYYIGDEDGDHLYYSKPLNEIKSIASRGKDNKDEYIPCWSLAALLGVLPKGTNISTPCPINELSYCCWNQLDEIYASNPVDACYEMILKLHEQKLL